MAQLTKKELNEMVVKRKMNIAVMACIFCGDSHYTELKIYESLKEIISISDHSIINDMVDTFIISDGTFFKREHVSQLIYLIEARLDELEVV